MDSIVYLIDDDDSVREALSSIIAEYGLNVRAFASGLEFFEAYEPTVVSEVIVVDMNYSPD